MSRLTDIQESAGDFGLYVEIWNPGDGVTQYRFVKEPAGPKDGIYTAYGAKEAETFLTGVSAGWYSREKHDAEQHTEDWRV